jgi:2-methylcitrate dehydratase PrpD
MNGRGQPIKTVAHRIAEFVARTTPDRLPANVCESAKLHILDGLATMLGGAKEESARQLCRHYAKLRGKPEASVLGTSQRLPAEQAALINGVQAHVLDYDDAQLTSQASRPMGQQTHPTAPVLAAALGLAESRRIGGSALLTGYIVGVEVACRLGDGIAPSHYLDGFHPTGTLGVFGAASACAHLLELKPLQILHALGIAGTLSSGLRANRGTMAKGLNAGHAAGSGLLSAQLAANGFTASENIFDDPMGFFSAACGRRVERDLLRFGKPFFLSTPGVAIKLYPCAGVLHPALDVVLALRQCHNLTESSIDQITVTLDPDATLPLVFDRPKTALETKFSLPFAMAAAMVDGGAGLTQFSTAALRNQKIQSLMRRVKLVRRAKANRRRRPGIETEVAITLRSGLIFRDHARIARGHPKLTPSRAQIEEKFRHCAKLLLTPRQCNRFLDTFWDIEHVDRISTWLRPIRPRRR